VNSHLDRNDDWVISARQARYRARHLAKLKRVSVRQLERYFGEAFNRCPQDWLDEVRLLEASLLLTNGKRVKEVAACLGFSDVAHFSHRFKGYYGCSPTQFVQIHDARMAERKRQFQQWYPGTPVPQDWLVDPGLLRFKAVLHQRNKPMVVQTRT
jgi:AraC-like DNA-binding protein